MEDLQDKELWLVAKRRASFRKSLIVYIVMNTFFWCIYLVNDRYSGFPWPLWAMLGWGIGLAFKYIEAYHGKDWFSTKREYDRLKESGK
ncbi:MAG: 2TM domain-containing protein [Chitinophagaceae bacterium]